MLKDLIDTDCDVDVYLSSTKKLPSKVIDEIDSARPDVVVLAIVPPGGIPQVKFLCNEIHSRCPDTTTIVAYLSKTERYDDLLVDLRTKGASYLTTSLGQTIHQIRTVHEDKVADESLGQTHSIGTVSDGAKDVVKYAR